MQPNDLSRGPHRRRSLLALTLGISSLLLAFGCASSKRDVGDTNAESTTSNADAGTSDGGSSSTTTDNGAGNGGAGTSTNGLAGAASSGGAAGMDTTDGSGGSTGDGGATGTTTAGNATTACQSNDDCSELEYCEFDDGLCGDGEPGTCLPQPMLASDGIPACGCDGVVYPERSFAKLALTDTDNLGRCDSAPECADGICEWCGDLLCNFVGDGSYCQITQSTCGTTYSCGLYPFDCEANDCSCLEESEGECSENDNGFSTLVRTVDVVCAD